jgi:hypothetical protein
VHRAQGKERVHLTTKGQALYSPAGEQPSATFTHNQIDIDKRIFISACYELIPCKTHLGISWLIDFLTKNLSLYSFLFRKAQNRFFSCVLRTEFCALLK